MDVRIYPRMLQIQYADHITNGEVEKANISNLHRR